MAKGKGINRKEIKATNALKKVMADHFYELDEASKTGSKKIEKKKSRSLGFEIRNQNGAA